MTEIGCRFSWVRITSKRGSPSRERKPGVFMEKMGTKHAVEFSCISLFLYFFSVLEVTNKFFTNVNCGFRAFFNW